FFSARQLRAPPRPGSAHRVRRVGGRFPLAPAPRTPDNPAGTPSPLCPEAPMPRPDPAPCRTGAGRPVRAPWRLSAAGPGALLVAVIQAAPAAAQQGREEAIKVAEKLASPSRADGPKVDPEGMRLFLEKYDQVSTQATLRCLGVLAFGLVVVGTAVWLRRG